MNPDSGPESDLASVWRRRALSSLDLLHERDELRSEVERHHADFAAIQAIVG